MFDMLKDLGRAAVGVALLPLDVVADVATLGGTLTDEPQPYTARRVVQISDALDDAVEG